MISSKKMTPGQRSDVILIFVFSAMVYLFASSIDIFERIAAFAAQHEKWEVDEVISVSIFLVFALSVFAFRRWSETIDANKALSHQNGELKKALSEIKRLRGILPICAACKRIRDDAGYWHQVELYIGNHTEAEFTHSICPDCRQKLYPEFTDAENDTGK